MDLKEYCVLFEVEDTLWWYQGMETITRAVIERFYARGSTLRILDVGCGTGGALRYLADYGTVLGIDLSHFALTLSRQRAPFAVACSCCTELPIPAGAFDLVTLIDLLPMLEGADDEMALGEAFRVLVAGGRLFLRAAAYDWLRGAHDRAWEVRHRYALSELTEKVCHAGFVIEHTSYANMWLLPVAIIKRSFDRIFPVQNGSDLTVNVGPLNGIFKAILSSEARWVAHHSLPFGLSIVMMARRP
jgi:SAM-dependent methyltransferase